MKSLLFGIICLAVWIQNSIQISTPESTFYVAGVVEYNYKTDQNSATQLKDNTKNYVNLINSQDARDVDVIVFPESTFNSVLSPLLIPSAAENVIPCDNGTYDESIQEISCAAKESKKYVVINVTMKKNCTEEVANSTRTCLTEWLYYNTNVVFDRSGTVIAVYRKHNLFGEFTINRTEVADIVHFKTDFDVTFGLFTCFDLLFPSPTMDLIKLGIKDFIFPTMWFSELPFLTASQAQQQWAQRLDVNLLAAGANKPEVGSTGSGIYSGSSGALRSIMTGHESSTLLVHKVPKVPGSTEIRVDDEDLGMTIDDLFLKGEKFENFTFLPIAETDDAQSLHLCIKDLYGKDFCCDFNITLSVNSTAAVPDSVHYTHAVAVHSNIRSFDDLGYGGLSICAVIACTDNKDLNTCNKRFDKTATLDSQRYKFEQLNITSSSYRNDEQLLIMPNTLKSNILPLNTKQYSYKETESSELMKTVEMNLIEPQDSLFTFAIYGRDFAMKSAAATNIAASFLVALSVLVCSFYYLTNLNILQYYL